MLYLPYTSLHNSGDTPLTDFPLAMTYIIEVILSNTFPDSSTC